MSYSQRKRFFGARFLVLMGFYALLFGCVVLAGIVMAVIRLGQGVGVLKGPPPLTAETVAEQLNAPRLSERRKAWKFLAELPPDRSRRDVADAISQTLANHLRSSVKLEDGARALADWGQPQDAPALKPLLDRFYNQSVRHSAIDALSALKGTAAVELLLEHLTDDDDRRVTRAALVRIGSSAEKQVVAYALEKQHPQKGRIAAIQVLSEIGGAESRKALQRLAEKDGPLRQFAKEALGKFSNHRQR